MDGHLFAKYAARPSVASGLRITERGELMEYFCKKINAGRVGVRFNGRPLQPIAMPRMGKILEQIPTKDLYYLKRICDDARHLSKKFWYELDVRKHQPTPTDPV